MVPFEDLPLYLLPSTLPLRVLGESSRSYWIILAQSEEENSSLQDFLSKILKALNLEMSIDTYRMIADHSNGFYLSKQFSDDDDPKIIIAFGFKPEELGLSIAYRPYQLMKLSNHQFLLCDLLDTIQDDPNKKRALWETLQLL